MEKQEYEVSKIERKILLIRGERVMIDADLAELYGVSTKRLNEQVRRNVARFPSDFAFRLTAEEKAEVVAKCDHLSNLKYSSALPFVFTEHDALMAANAVKSPRAAEVSVSDFLANYYLYDDGDASDVWTWRPGPRYQFPPQHEGEDDA